jgi:predicted lipoprotein with Yx(FWY)xxD motif
LNAPHLLAVLVDGVAAQARRSADIGMVAAAARSTTWRRHYEETRFVMIKSKRLPLYVAGGAGLSALAVALGLAVSNSGSTGSALSTSPATTVVTTRGTGLGSVLVDAQGRTLYLFAKDIGPASTCDGSCASFWPPVPVSGAPRTAGGVSAASLGVITRSGGRRQLSYAGHPLYYFVGDSKPGQTRGQGLSQFGAKWFVLDAAGAAVANTPSTAGNGGGYGY